MYHKASERSIDFFRIGSGSFATVYINTATPDIYKKCRFIEGRDTLADEYHHLKRINDALRSSGNTILSPTPIDLYTQDDHTFWDDPIFAFPERDNEKTSVYAMTRVYPLPSALKAKIIELFCPPCLKDDKNKFDKIVRQGHHVARLLLGRPEYDTERVAPKRFFNTYNFPLTRRRAEQLGVDTTLLSAEMGKMLAQFHMTARNDARDVEIVLGADITNECRPHTRRDPRVWVIDFNQVREFDFTEKGIPLLVNGFFMNDPYFPRARPGVDELYSTFKGAYLGECKKIGEIAGRLGERFVIELEAEQKRLDERRVGEGELSETE